jgi:glycosyltransferase involved in cell wall biosynthesis
MYPHKNIEILIDVAKILKERNIFINFKLTFSSQSGKKESNFINIVTRRNLLEYFTFTGRLSRESLVTEIKLSSGIIMPTLIETYGLPYLEAQIFKKVMFTSDRDFARELCGESAVFFDPLNPNDIAEKIIENIFSDKIMQKHVNAIDKEMKKRISWDESSRLILEEA